MEHLASATTLALGIVFLAAGSGKLLGRERFRETLLLTGFVAPRHVPAVRVLLPALELLAGVLLVSGALRWLGLLLALGLLVLFTVRAWPAARTGTAVPCSCFGTTGESIDAGMLARNLVLITYAVVGWLALPSGPDGPAVVVTTGPGPRLVTSWVPVACMLVAPFVLAHLVSLWQAAPRLADLPALADPPQTGDGS
jgi:putative oxidoreductase